MSIQIGWDKSHTDVLRCDFIGVKEPAEYERALEQLTAFASPDPTQTLKFIIIVVNVTTEDLPPVSVLKFMRALVDMYSKQIECMVIVTRDPLLEVLVQLIQPFYCHFGIRLSHSPDVQHALSYIDKIPPYNP